MRLRFNDIKNCLIKIVKKSWKTILPLFLLILVVTGYLVYSFDSYNLDKIKKSVLLLRVYNGSSEVVSTGSGFIAFDNDILVTNAHVIEDVVKNYSYYLEVISEENKLYKVLGVLGYSKSNDYAILRIENQNDMKPLKVAPSIQNVGNKVLAIGSPLGLKNTVSDGIISNYYDNEQRYQFTAPISPGSSGGALFNNKGEVIGITYASNTDGQNLNLAIPIKFVKNRYEEEKNNVAVSLVYADDLYKDVLNDGVGLDFLNMLDDYWVKPDSIDDVSSHYLSNKLDENAHSIYIGYQHNNPCFGLLDKTSCFDGYYNIYIIGPITISDKLLDKFNSLINKDWKYHLQLNDDGTLEKKLTSNMSSLSGHTNKYLYYVEYNNFDNFDKIKQELEKLP